jgi:aminoglycoside 2'-N-acetyltransferase I
MPGLEIAVVPNPELPDGARRNVLDLCSRAYEEDFEPYFNLLSTATHLLGTVDGRLVGHVAWVERELRSPPIGPMRTAYVEAVATLPEYQGRGFASQLLARIPALVTGFDLAALSPSSEGFYARVGWETWQGPLSYRDHTGIELATPDEVVMIHRLPLTPVTLDLKAPLSTDWRPL